MRQNAKHFGIPRIPEQLPVHDPLESIAGSPRASLRDIAVSMLSSLLQQPAPPPASEPDAVSPATLMKENGRSRSASSWREADLSPIAVIHELMHGAHCRHASSVQRLGAKPILHTSSESLADFADHVDFELADGTMDYWSGCPHFAEGGAPASPRCTFVPGSPRCAGSPRMPGSFARRRCGELRRALGYGDAGGAADDGDAGGVDYEDQRPLAVYAFVALVVVGVVAWLLRLEEGEGIRLICEHYHTCLMGVVLIPVFHSLRGQKLALDGHDSDSD